MTDDRRQHCPRRHCANANFAGPPNGPRRGAKPLRLTILGSHLGKPGRSFRSSTSGARATAAGSRCFFGARPRRLDLTSQLLKRRKFVNHDGRNAALKKGERALPICQRYHLSYTDFRPPCPVDLKVQQCHKPGPMFGPMDFGIADDGERSGREQGTQIAIPSFADVAKLVLASARILLRNQPDPS